jgi:hypothetical protein
MNHRPYIQRRQNEPGSANAMTRSKHMATENVSRLLLLVVAISFSCILSTGHSVNDANKVLLSRRMDKGPSTLSHDPIQNRDGLVVDIMSVGSKTRLDYQKAQQKTFAMHTSVRFFFNITEDDDADRNCSNTLLPSDTYAIAKFCRPQRRSKWGSHHVLMRYMRTRYSRPEWLEKKPSPNGWMCAQTRPTHGFAKVLAQYRAMKETYGDAALPDYLIIADDDTYVNMELFAQYMSNFDPVIPRAIAGCLVRTQSTKLNFSFPYGGYGTIFSRGKYPNHHSDKPLCFLSTSS